LRRRRPRPNLPRPLPGPEHANAAPWSRFHAGRHARTIRAAKQAGAEYVEVRADGTIFVRLKDVPISVSTSPTDDPQPVQQEIIL
jgi:hypothetical protein